MVRPYKSRASGPMTCLLISPDKFQRLLDDHPEISRLVLLGLAPLLDLAGAAAEQVHDMLGPGVGADGDLDPVLVAGDDDPADLAVVQAVPCC
jgi:CRP-like cAMP-binding protein